ncbi:MAG: type II secretion system F family protein [Acetobacterales bacterium]
MPRFQVRAVAASGEVTERTVEAPDRDAVIDGLRRGDALPVSVVPVGGEAEPPKAAAEATGRARERPGIGWRRGVPQGDVTLFLRSLETLVGAGLNADRALAVAAESAGRPQIAAAAEALRGRLRSGATLSDAMAEHPGLFDGFDRAMVRAGESGSALAPALGRLAEARERRERLGAAVTSALVYPAVLLTASGVSVVVLLTVVVPQFEVLFRESAAELPLLTRIVVGGAALLRDWGWLPVLALAGGWFFMRQRLRTPEGRAERDRRLLALPLAGDLLRGLAAERLCRSLGALLSGGVALPDALRLAADTAGNAAVAERISAAAALERGGERLADALARRPVLPPLALGLLRVGEESGTLPAMLRQAADGLAADAEMRLRRLVALIEPVLIVAIGLVVAVIVLALLSAIIGVHALVL